MAGCLKIKTPAPFSAWGMWRRALIGEAADYDVCCEYHKHDVIPLAIFNGSGKHKLHHHAALLSSILKDEKSDVRRDTAAPTRDHSHQ